MTRLSANFSFNQDDLDLNRLVRFGDESFFFEDVNIVFNGVNYRDVVEVLWSDGFNFYASDFGGNGISVNSRGDITGGTVTGYLESVFLGGQYVISYGIQNFTISAERIYNAALTRSKTDDNALLRDLFDGDDVLSMSSGDDIADGLDGDDIVRGFGGDDSLRGGQGNDTLNGGLGNDTLDGGQGHDQVQFSEDLSSYEIAVSPNGDVLVSSNGSGGSDRVANAEEFTFADQTLTRVQIEALINPAPEEPDQPIDGSERHIGTALNDTIRGLIGDDTVVGQAGDDLLLGGAGDDNIRGSGGDDRLRGNAGNDTLKGNGGDDNLKGGGGDDNMRGGGGADTLNGGGGDDRLIGGGGDDVLTGKRGDDTLKGNGGADVFQFRASDRNDTILDFRQGVDQIEIKSGASFFQALTIEQDGQDVLISFAAAQIRVVTDNAAAFSESDFIF